MTVRLKRQAFFKEIPKSYQHLKVVLFSEAKVFFYKYQKLNCYKRCYKL